MTPHSYENQWTELFPKIIFKTQTKAMNGLLFLTCLESFLEARAAHSVSSWSSGSGWVCSACQAAVGGSSRVEILFESEASQASPWFVHEDEEELAASLLMFSCLLLDLLWFLILGWSGTRSQGLSESSKAGGGGEVRGRGGIAASVRAILLLLDSHVAISDVW